MDAFWKAVAVVILTTILSITIGKTEKDISIVLNVVACCIVLMVAIHYLADVIAFLWQLGTNSEFQKPFMGTLLKISGIALVTELTGLISSDAGNESLRKAVQFLGNTVILFLSLPLLESFFATIQEIMGLI